MQLVSFRSGSEVRREAYLRPLRDIRVIGYDDLGTARMWEPPLSTVSPPRYIHGPYRRCTAASAHGRRPFDGPRLLPPDVVIHESCGCSTRHRRRR